MMDKKDLKQDKKMIASAVHKHEKRLHQGMTPTGEEPAKETMRKQVVTVANTRSQDYPPTKTSGIKIRGTGAATKGLMARGPMA